MTERQFFGMRKAAEYLDVSIDTMKSYVHRKKLIVGEKDGHDIIFTRQQLDDLKVKLAEIAKTPNKKGRPLGKGSANRKSNLPPDGE